MFLKELIKFFGYSQRVYQFVWYNYYALKILGDASFSLKFVIICIYTQ